MRVDPRSRKSYESLNERLPQSFTEAHLDIRDYLEEHKLFVLNDGDYAKIYEFSGFYGEDKVLEELKDHLLPLQKGFRAIFSGIPRHLNQGNVGIQVILSSRRIKTPPIKLVNGKPYAFSETLVGDFLRSEEEFLFNHYHFKDRKFYLCVRFTPNPDYRTAKEIVVDFFKEKKYLDLIRPESAIQTSFDGLEKTIRLFKSELKSLETVLSETIELKEVSLKDTIGYIQNVVNSAATLPDYLNNHNIHTVIESKGVEATKSGVKNKSGGFSEVYYLNQMPNSFCHGAISHFIDEIPHSDFDLIWTITRGSKKAGNDINGRIGHFDGKASKVDIVEDFRSFKKEISSFNPYGVCSLRLLVHNPPEEFESRMQSVANDYLYSGMEKEEQIGAHMFATSLPMNCNRYSNELRSRSRKLTLEKSLSLLPIFDGPSREHGTSWRLSRSSTPTRFDPHAGEAGKHLAALGSTRKGKSSFINYVLLGFFENKPKAIVRAIDWRTSYQKIADLVGGKIVDFSEERLRKNPSSPFAIEDFTNDDIAKLVSLIEAVILIRNPSAQVDDMHRGFLRDAIARTYRSFDAAVNEVGDLDSQNMPPHPVWENILASFPKTKEIKEQGGVNLDLVVGDIRSWTTSLEPTGELGFIFSAYQHQSEAASDCPFLVYDLEGIEDKKLRKIASMIAAIKINRDFGRVAESSPKIFLVDELGQQVKTDSTDESAALSVMGDLIVSVAATAAKANGQLIAITNQVSDYTDNPAGRAVWGLSDQKVFLPLASLKRPAKLAWNSDFSKGEWSVIEDLRLQKHHHRSMYYLSSENEAAPYKGSGYIPLSPYMDALVTSSSSQLELYKKLRAEGKNAFDSIVYMAKHHPYGEDLQKDSRDEAAEKEGLENERINENKK